MEFAAQTPNLLSVELVEYNPDSDHQGTTAEFAIGLIESAMGKSIL
jgi:arginase family enzyme